MATICRKRSGNSEITDSQPKRKAIETKIGPIIEKDTESITIHIIKTKISSAHLVQLKQLAIKNKIIVSEHFKLVLHYIYNYNYIGILYKNYMQFAKILGALIVSVYCFD